MFVNIFLIFIFDLVRKIMQNPNRISYTYTRVWRIGGGGGLVFTIH